MHVQVGADKVTKLLSGDPQTMDRIVNSCPLTKFVGSLMILHEAEDDDVNWLNSMQTIYHSRNKYFDLMWICCTTYSCTSAAVDKIPTDRQRVDSRSVCDKQHHRPLQAYLPPTVFNPDLPISLNFFAVRLS